MTDMSAEERDPVEVALDELWSYMEEYGAPETTRRDYERAREFYAARLEGEGEVAEGRIVYTAQVESKHARGAWKMVARGKTREGVLHDLRDEDLPSYYDKARVVKTRVATESIESVALVRHREGEDV